MAKSSLQFVLPEEEREFRCASASIQLAALIHAIESCVNDCLEYDPDRFQTGAEALEHISGVIREYADSLGIMDIVWE